MVHSRSVHLIQFQKLFCRFYVDNVDLLRISVLPSVLGTARNPAFDLEYSLLCSIVRHVCSPVCHLVEHSTLLY
jgi:hypothetical protein